MALSLSQDLVPLFEDYFLWGPYRNIDLCLTQIFGYCSSTTRTENKEIVIAKNIFENVF
jgi:hypothetical protein